MTSTPSASRQRTSASAPVMRSLMRAPPPCLRTKRTSRSVRARPSVTARLGRAHAARRAASSSSSTCERDRAGVDVDGDRVALGDERDRAARRRLGGHVADRRALRGAGEAPVGDERDARARAPCPLIAEVGVSISRMPGPALGTLVADDDDVAGDDARRRGWPRRRPPRHSKTRAGPVCTRISGGTADCLTTAPSGARLPRSTRRPPSG